MHQPVRAEGAEDTASRILTGTIASMDSDKVNLVIKQGDTFRAQMEILELDFTGCSGKMQLRLDIADLAPEVIHEMTVANTGISFDGAHIVRMHIPKSITSTFTYDMTGLFDLEITWPSGDTFTIMEGHWKIKPDVTV